VRIDPHHARQDTGDRCLLVLIELRLHGVMRQRRTRCDDQNHDRSDGDRAG
jgi:hypothetical protein